MPVPILITELSTTASSNGPVGTSDSPAVLDDHQRAHAAFIAQLRDGTGFTAGAIPNSKLANAAVANLSGVNTGDQTNITGNAATATTAVNQSGGSVNATTGAFSGSLTNAGNAVRHNGNIFHGRVNSAGNTVRLPVGWSSVRNSIGNYTVIHGLGTANYSRTLQANVVGVVAAGANGDTASFSYLTYDVNAVLTDTGVSFILMLD